MIRFMALLWNEVDPEACCDSSRLIARLESSGGSWVKEYSAGGIYVARHDDGSERQFHLLEQGYGAVVGTLFSKRSAESPRCQLPLRLWPTKEHVKSTVQERARTLVTDYWGRYVAFLKDSDGKQVWIVKDPTGRLPCFWSRIKRVTLVFSRACDFYGLHREVIRINWNFLTQRVGVGLGLFDETAISGVFPILGGQMICGSAPDNNATFCWNPVSISESDSIEDPVAAVKELRHVTQFCTHAWAESHKSILHRTSGGLDSSIVLACLRSAPTSPRVTPVTYRTEHSVSDETQWARLAVGGAFSEHIEIGRDPSISLRPLLDMEPLITPPFGLSFLEIGPLEHRLASERGATAVFSGDGGDTIFGKRAAPFAVLDSLRRRGFTADILKVASNAALLKNWSIWRLFSNSIADRVGRRSVDDLSGLLRQARYCVRDDVREPAMERRQQLRHPWFRNTGRPSSVSKLADFITLPDLYYNPLKMNLGLASREPEPVSPLTSQPLVELCLRIPSYTQIAYGEDRALARRAFVGDVPAPILSRLWKDRAVGHLEETIRENRLFLTELLLDGFLVKERLLDRSRLELALRGSLSRGSTFPVEIMDHALVEAWMHSVANLA